MSQTMKLLNAFRNGEELTSAQISSRYGLANPTAAVDSLRSQGYAIYCNRGTNWRGESINRFRLGTPNRAMVQAAHAAGVFAR